MSGRPSQRALALVVAVWLVGVGAVYAVAGVPPELRGRTYAALTIAESALMLLAWRLASDDVGARLLVRAGVLGRLLLVFVPAFTSNDASRYIWDGAAALAGFDPYFYSPRGIATSLPGFHVPPDNAGYVTLYPPGALGLFVVAASFGAKVGPFVWKLLVTLASIGSVVVTDHATRRSPDRGALALVALSPVLVFESGVGAHVDAFAALAVACGASAWLERRHSVTAAWFALGGLFKLTPALALVPLFFAAPRAMRARMLLVGSFVFLGGYRIAMRVGFRPIGSLHAFLTDWRFGSPIFTALESAVGASNALRGAGVIAVVFLVASIVVARRIDPLRGALVALAAPFVASPVVFPWYLAGQAPLVAIRPSMAWLAWAIALPSTYEVLDRVARGQVWSASSWPLVGIVGAVVVGASLDGARILRAPPASDAHSGEP